MGLWDNFGSTFSNTVNTISHAQLNDQQIQDLAYKRGELQNQDAAMMKMAPAFQSLLATGKPPDINDLYAAGLQMGINPKYLPGAIDGLYKTFNGGIQSREIRGNVDALPKPQVNDNGVMTNPVVGMNQIAARAALIGGTIPDEKTIQAMGPKWEKTTHGAETKFTDVNTPNPAANTQTVNFTPTMGANINTGGTTVTKNEYGKTIDTTQNTVSPGVAANNNTKLLLASQKLSPNDYKLYLDTNDKKARALAKDPNADVSGFDTLLSTLEAKMFGTGGDSTKPQPYPRVTDYMKPYLEKIRAIKDINEKRKVWQNNQWLLDNLREQIDPATGQPYSEEKVQAMARRIEAELGI